MSTKHLVQCLVCRQCSACRSHTVVTLLMWSLVTVILGAQRGGAAVVSEEIW